MKISQAKQRLAKLRAEIDYHRHQYHVLDRETISPAALDSLKQELVSLEQAFPELITPNSPSQRVGGQALDKFNKVNHRQPMLSLNDAFSLEDLISWQERNFNFLKISPPPKFTYYCELKLDGLAASLIYRQGQLVQGATRGDGLVGEEVTANLKTIKSIPLTINLPSIKQLLALGLSKILAEKWLALLKNSELEIRGEAIMPKSVWQELNKQYQVEGKNLLANTRNGAAGSLRQLDPRVAASRRLDFYAYDLLIPGESLENYLPSRQIAENLTALLGFKTVKQNRLCPDLNKVQQFYQEIIKEREKLDFNIDGLVLKINDLVWWSKLGVVGKAPRFMIAYKFPAEQATSKVLDIVWQVGRTGVLTPAAVLEPVSVGGATVSRATLHNFDEIQRLDIRLGDTVILERAGDVIPKIIQVLPGLREKKALAFQPPTHCPRCNSLVKRAPEMAAYRCLNKNCQASAERRLIHFVSRPALDIAGLGESIVIQLIDQGLVETPADFYRLRLADLLSLPGFAAKKAANLLAAISAKKNISLARFIFALGILQVGEESARLIAREFINNYSKNFFKNFSSPITFLKWAQKYSAADWQKLPDIGPVVAASLVNFFQDEATEELFRELTDLDLKLNWPVAVASPLAGKKFVFSGSLSGLTRQEAKDKISLAGGQVKSSVSQEIDWLVAGSEPGSKYQQAEKLGIKIINEDELLALLNS